MKVADGTIWKNVVTEEVSKVAETLAEYRGRYKYNLMDHNVRGLYAEVPLVAQWDDHETRRRGGPRCWGSEQLAGQVLWRQDLDPAHR